MRDIDSRRLREIDAELRTVAKQGFKTMFEYVVKFGFSDCGATYQTVMEAGSRGQAELAFRRRYFREANLRVRSVAKSSRRARPYNPYVLAVQAGVISREEHARRTHDPDDPVKMRRGWTGPDGTPVRVRARRQEDKATTGGVKEEREEARNTEGKPMGNRPFAIRSNAGCIRIHDQGDERPAPAVMLRYGLPEPGAVR